MRKISIVLLITLLSVAGGALLFEWLAAATDPTAKDFWWQYPQKSIPIAWQSVTSISSITPVTVPARDLDYHGPAPWESRGRIDESTIFHIHSDKYGFFNAQSIDELPPKEPNEFRIVLIGGSGAQGHGATSNDKMMYNLLQNKLQGAFNKDHIKIRVINLALAGGEARNNSNTLHAFGHKAYPDLILAYNGANDISQTPRQYDGEMCNNYVANLMDATYIQPAWVLTLGKFFPALMYKYGAAGYIKKKFYSNTYKEQGLAKCFNDLGVDIKDSNRTVSFFEHVTAPMFVDHFKSIKRDFCGIPIMLAWQAVSDGQSALYDMWLTRANPKTNPIININNFGAEEVKIKFYNPQKLHVYILITSAAAPKPSLEDVLNNGNVFRNENGFIKIKYDHFKNIKNPSVYYTLENEKEVYPAYTEEELTKFRRIEGIYQQFYKYNKAQLDGYMNPYWYFVNVDNIAHEIDISKIADAKIDSISVHMDDMGQQIVADIIYKKLAPVIRVLIHDHQPPKCKE